MAETNTLSILESIRKKIQKLDEPRKPEGKDFSDISDEFDYASPAKKTSAAQKDAASEKVEEAPPAKPEQIEDDNTMERKITESFESADDKNIETDIAAEPLESEVVESDDHDFTFDEEDVDQGEISLEPEIESEMEIPELEPEEFVEEFEEDAVELDEPNLEIDDAVVEMEESNLEIEEETTPEADPVAEQGPEENLELPEESEEWLGPDQLQAQEEKAEPVKNSDEDELEELLRQEALSKARSISDKALVDKVAPPVIAPAAPTYISTQSAPIESINSMSQTTSGSTKKTFINVDEFLTNTGAEESLLSQKAASNITDSIRKLVDAKNVVSGVTSFSKSEAFSDIAAQLMEPRLEKWLNENLPDLVERIVREEIKKIIPKE